MVGGLTRRGLQRPVLQVQAADAHRERRTLPGIDDALGPHRPALRAVTLAEGPGGQDAELPAGLVLLRRRPVGIEDVALVEHGVGDGVGGAEALVGGRGTEVLLGLAAPGHGSASPARFSSSSSAWSHVGSPRRALKPCKESSVSRPHPQPPAVGEVAVHGAPPHGHGQAERCFQVPRHRLGGEPRLASAEHGAAEQQQQRDLAVAQGVKVLRPRHLEVVAALDGQVDLGRRRETGDGRGHVGPEKGPQRVAPPGRVAEQLVEAGLLIGRVVAALGLDAYLAAKSQSVDGGARLLGHPQPQHDRGHGGVALGLGTHHGEAQRAHRALARTRSKKPSRASCASRPPSKPRHSRRSWPTSS